MEPSLWLDADYVAAKHNTPPDEAARALALATELVDAQVAQAFRAVPQLTYDDWTRRVVAVIATSGRRTGNGQLTKPDQPAQPRDRDYLSPISRELASYTVTGM